MKDTKVSARCIVFGAFLVWRVAPFRLGETFLPLQSDGRKVFCGKDGRFLAWQVC